MEIEMLAIPENIQAGLLNLWAGNVILALLANTSQDESKQLNCLVARFDATDGVLKSSNTFLDSTDVVVRGRGEINAGDRTIDMLFAPQAKRERFFSVKAPFEVKGPWNDVSVGLAPGSFASVVFRWSLSLFYVPFKWLTGERFPKDGRVTCFNATRWDMPASMQAP